MRPGQSEKEASHDKITGIVLTSDLEKEKAEQARAIVLAGDKKIKPDMPNYVSKEYLDPTTGLIMQEPVDDNHGVTHEKSELEKLSSGNHKDYKINKFAQKAINQFLEKHPELYKRGLVYLSKERRNKLNQQIIAATQAGSLNQLNKAINAYGPIFNEHACLTVNQQTLMHLACQHNQPQIVARLHQLQFSFASKDKDGNTPLHILAITDNIKLLTFAIKKNGVLEIKNNKGFTPAHWALAKNKIKAFEYLVEQGAACSTVTDTGQTMLHTAAKIGCQPAVTLLLRKGLNDTVKNNQGHTASDCARKQQRFEFVNWFTQQLLQQQLLHRESHVKLAIAVYSLHGIVEQQQRRIHALEVPENPLLEFTNQVELSLAEISEKLKANVTASTIRYRRQVNPFSDDTSSIPWSTRKLFAHQKSENSECPGYEEGGKIIQVWYLQTKFHTNVTACGIQLLERHCYVNERSGFDLSDKWYTYTERSYSFKQSIGKLYIFHHQQNKLFTILLYDISPRGDAIIKKQPANACQRVRALDVSNSYYVIALNSESDKYRWQVGNYHTEQQVMLSGNDAIHAALIVNDQYLVLASKQLRFYDLKKPTQKPKELDNLSSDGKLIQLDQTRFGYVVQTTTNQSSRFIGGSKPCYQVTYQIKIYDINDQELITSIMINEQYNRSPATFHVSVVGDLLFLVDSGGLKQYNIENLKEIRSLKFESNNFKLANGASLLLYQSYLYIINFMAMNQSHRVHLISGEITPIKCQSLSHLMTIQQLGQQLRFYSSTDGEINCMTLPRLPSEKIEVDVQFRRHFQNQLDKKIVDKENLIKLSLKPMSWNQASEIFTQFITALKLLLGEGYFIAKLSEKENAVVITCLNTTICQQVNNFIESLRMTKAAQFAEAQRTLSQLSSDLQASRSLYTQLGVTLPAMTMFNLNQSPSAASSLQETVPGFSLDNGEEFETKSGDYITNN